MGIRLIVEVFDDAPQGLGAPERLLLLALAEKANDETRMVIWPRGVNPRALLMQRMDVSDSGLGKVFTRLAARGLDPRVPLGTDKHGRPVFAYEGRACEYRIPVLRGDLFGGPLEPECLPERGASEGTRSGDHLFPFGGPLEPERSPDRVAHVPPSLRSPDTRAIDDAATQLITLHGGHLALNDAQAIVTAIAQRYPAITNLAAYVARIPLPDLRTNLPAKASPPHPSGHQCEHGVVRGLEVRGRGENRSRICGRCEAQRPADSDLEAS